jgi:hypothetical protein
VKGKSKTQTAKMEKTISLEAFTACNQINAKKKKTGERCSMLTIFSKKHFFIISTMVLFLLAYQNQVTASKVVAAFNATNATGGLQGAINAGKDTVLVPYVGAEWIVTPINCNVSNQTIIFEKGVIITAMKGTWPAWTNLFTIKAVSNVSFIGYGATLKMQKAEYMSAPGYNPETDGGGSRMGIGIYESSGINILGLTIKETGGDGVFIYANCSNLLLKDLILDDNCRTAIAPIDYKNLTIENCVLINTSAGSPANGIDWEPDWPYFGQVNGKMTNCFVEKNVGTGISFAFQNFNQNTIPVSIDIKHSYISGGMLVWGVADVAGTTGTVKFDDCIIGNVSGNSAPDFGFTCKKSANSLPMTFTNCKWQNCRTIANFLAGGSAATTGGLEFVNNTVNKPDSQASFVLGGLLRI